MSRKWRAVRDVAVVTVVLGLLLAWHAGKFDHLAPSSPTDAGLGRLVAPVPGGRVTSGFGSREASAKVSASHYGTDIAAPLGTPIRSVADGEVIVARPASGFGLWMQVRHRDGTVSVYGHMNRMLRKVGDRVRAGDTIAEVGARGEATGPHLHLEIWPHGDRSQHTDPVPWFAARHASITTRSAA